MPSTIIYGIVREGNITTAYHFECAFRTLNDARGYLEEIAEWMPGNMPGCSVVRMEMGVVFTVLDEHGAMKERAWIEQVRMWG
jgi:hypothetical protein